MEPRDLFKDAGQLDPARLAAKLNEARLLKTSLADVQSSAKQLASVARAEKQTVGV